MADSNVPEGTNFTYSIHHSTLVLLGLMANALNGSPVDAAVYGPGICASVQSISATLEAACDAGARGDPEQRQRLTGELIAQIEIAARNPKLPRVPIPKAAYERSWSNVA